MSSPYYTSKTDKAEYARFQLEHKRANQIANMIIIGIVLVMFSLAYLLIR
jgi:hypothetical protein